ncbi:uncharacterized protein BJ171DRAFT_496928, partial [Polychytrium aggregatum]|uniref:uncharacterized protein n=1 Tax=Polychytrium aggregatum TaxID=110093 RepID=UPI0022FEF79F
MSVPQPPAGAMAAQAVTIGHEQKQPPASTPKLLATKYSGLARGFKPRPVTAPTTLKERAIAASCSHDTQVDSDAALKLSEVIQSLEWWVDHRLCPGFESWTESHLPTELEQAHVAQGHIELRTPPPAQNLDQSVCRGEFDCLMSSWRPVVESNSSKATVKVEARPPKVLLDKVKKAERRTSKPPSTRIGDLSGGNGEEVSAKHAMSDKDRRAAYGPWYIVPSKWKAVLDKRTNPEIKHAGIYAVHPDVPRSSFVVEKLKQMIEDRAKADQLALQDVVVQSPPRSISAFSRTEPVTSSRSMSIFSHADSLPPASSMAQLSPRRQASVSSANSSRRSLHRLSIDYSPMRTFSISTPLQLPGLD